MVTTLVDCGRIGGHLVDCSTFVKRDSRAFCGVQAAAYRGGYLTVGLVTLVGRSGAER